MKRETDYNSFKMMWTTTHAKLAAGKAQDDTVISSIFDDLEEYPLSWIEKALKIHSQTKTFAPAPADIIRLIKERTGLIHPGADEAWAIMRKSFDERETVVCTAQMLEAKSAADDVLDYGGSQFDASRAFKDAYNRIINATDAPVKWQASYGTDKNLKLQAISAAVEKGLLPASSLETPLIENNANIRTTTVAGLIEGAVDHADNPEEIKARWKDLLGALKASVVEDEKAKIAESQERINAKLVERASREQQFQFAEKPNGQVKNPALAAIDALFDEEFGK